jgi:amidase
MTDWTGRTATEIAAAVRAGEATAGPVVACHLDRIAKLNGELSAFIRVRAAEAASEAEAVGMRADLAELPLAGVPVAVKDAQRCRTRRRARTIRWSPGCAPPERS